MSLDILPRKTTTTWITWTVSLQVSDAKVWETGDRNVRSVPISYHLGWHLWRFLWWWQKTRKIGSPCHPYHRPVANSGKSGEHEAAQKIQDWLEKGHGNHPGLSCWNRCFWKSWLFMVEKCGKKDAEDAPRKFCSEIQWKKFLPSFRIPTQLAVATIWKNCRQKIRKLSWTSRNETALQVGGALVAPKDLIFLNIPGLII